MSILREIRQQPLWVRELMFMLSVVITISAVGAMWFNSFQHDIVAIGDTDTEVQQKFFAQQESGRPPLALIGKGFTALRAGIYGLLNLDSAPDLKVKPTAVYPMPLVEDR